MHHAIMQNISNWVPHNFKSKAYKLCGPMALPCVRVSAQMHFYHIWGTKSVCGRLRIKIWCSNLNIVMPWYVLSTQRCSFGINSAAGQYMHAYMCKIEPALDPERTPQSTSPGTPGRF